MGKGATPGGAGGMDGLVAGGGGRGTPDCCGVDDFLKWVLMSLRASIVAICIAVGAASALVMVV